MFNYVLKNLFFTAFITISCHLKDGLNMHTVLLMAFMHTMLLMAFNKHATTNDNIFYIAYLNISHVYVYMFPKI